MLNVVKAAAVVALAALGSLLDGQTLDSRPRAVHCDGSITSRWSTGAGAYERDKSFGQGASEWLVSVLGLASNGTRLVLYDATESRVRVLDAELRQIVAFGRSGGGPGELAELHSISARYPFWHFTGNAVAVDDSLIYVYDGRSIQSYRFDGTYVDRLANVRRGPAPFSLMKLQATKDALLFNYDSLDIARTGTRRLQTWKIDSEGQKVIHSVRLDAPPLANASFSLHSRDPLPMWAANDSCVIWGDGVLPWLFRFHMASETTDSIRLPPHRVPPADIDQSVSRRFLEWHKLPPPPARSRNAPLWHWSGLILDPDGHAWVRPWTPGLRHRGTVYRVDPMGRVHAENLPDFPWAFGPPGVFYTKDLVPETEELVIVRYERRPTRGRNN